MKKIIGLSCLIGLSAPVATYANHQGSNPVSKEWVISTLTMQAADWQALCPAGVPITSGCLPNCQSGDNLTKAACKKVLKFTGLQNLAGVTETNTKGLYAIALNPGANSSVSGPQITNNSSFSGVTCALFSPEGIFVAPTILDTNTNTLVSNPPIAINPSTGPTSYGANNGALFSAGGVPENTTYYMMCMSFNPNTNIAYNLPTDEVSVSW